MHEVWVRHRIYGEKAAGRVSSPEERLGWEEDKIFRMHFQKHSGVFPNQHILLKVERWNMVNQWNF